MKRKVIQLAGRTLVVSLPQDWTSKNEIAKGDSVDLEISGKNIVIAPDEKKSVPEPKTISIDVSELDERVVRWLLSCLHKKGYDEIKIKFADPKIIDVVNELIKDLFVGFAIMDQNETCCTLKSISIDSSSDFDALLRRAFIVCLQMGEETLRIIKKRNTPDLKSLISMEHTNNQLTNFCERILNKDGYEDYENTCFMYVIVWNLEKICDNYKYMCNYLSGQQDSGIKIPDNILDIFSGTNSLMRLYYELFYKFDLKGLNILKDKGKELIDQSRLLNAASVHEAVIIQYLMDIAIHVMDFSASTIALKYFAKNKK